MTCEDSTKYCQPDGLQRLAQRALMRPGTCDRVLILVVTIAPLYSVATDGRDPRGRPASRHDTQAADGIALPGGRGAA